MKAYVLLLSLLLTGCSALDLINPLSGGGVNSNAQVGKENTQQVVANQTATTNTVQGDQITSKVTGDNIKEVSINEVPLWIVMLAIFGWMMPTPTNIWKWFKGEIKGIFKFFRKDNPKA